MNFPPRASMLESTPRQRDLPDDVPIYKIESATKIYGEGANAVHALNDVSLNVRSHEFVAIEGPSGSGKSTLLQLLGALDVPTSGRVLFEGNDLEQMSDDEQADFRRAAVGFVFQHFNLIPTLSAEQNVAAALAPSQLSAPQMSERATTLLERVGLAARAGHLPSQLSGGEQQRVAIARALANGARVLLADEPTGNLDSATGDEVMSVLHGLWQDEGLTMIVITHDQRIAEQAQRVLRMQDGQIVADADRSARVPG